MSSTYPTYEALEAEGPTSRARVSVDFLRLHWILENDSLQSSITVLQDATDDSSAQEPYSSAHPISDCALTFPPVSAITVSTEVLDNYSQNWTETHGIHAEHEDSPDYTGERFDAEGFVEHCCDQDRPGEGPHCDVVAEPGRFVTIGQFVEVVHPWLRSLDLRLREAHGVWSCWPISPDVPMIVWPTRLSQLYIDAREGRQPENYSYGWKTLARTAQKMSSLRHDGSGA